MVYKTVIAILVILGIPAGLFLYYDALMLRSHPTSLAAYDSWMCLGGALAILLLEVLGLRPLLRGQFRRKRKLKIAALAITSFVFLIWQVSVVVELGHGWPGGVWTFLSHGCFDAGIDRAGRTTGWTMSVAFPAHPPSMYWERVDWWPRTWRSRGGTLDAIRVPLWAVYVATLIPTVYLFWRCRRLPSGYCQECSYDLTGNVSGVCPECGKATGVTAPSSTDH